MPRRTLRRLLAGTLVFMALGSTALAGPQRSPNPPGDGYVTTDAGIRLHYRVLGSGPDTLVIPGESWWAGHADALARGRRAVLYDTRNRGRSEAVTDTSKLGIEHDVRDLERLHRQLSLKRTTLIGWSYLGAMVALYAAEHPDDVAAVVQVGPMSLRRHPYWDEYLKDQAARQDVEEQRQLARMRNAGLPDRDPQAYCRAYWPALVRATLANPAAAAAAVPGDICDLPNEWPQRIAATFGRVIAGLGAWDWRPKVRSVRARSLVIHGARDNIPLESSQEWARILPDARLLVLDGSGHYPFVEQPQEFVRAVETFVAGGWPQGAAKPLAGPAAQTRSGFADVAGGRLYYEVSGSGEPVVLIHGNVGDRRHWDRQVEELARSYRVIRYDVRGFGASSVPTEGEAYSDHEDLARLLDHLGVKSAHLVGWSMGAAIAADFVLLDPARAKSLVSVGPWVSGISSPATQALFRDLRSVSAALPRGTAAAVQAWMDAPFFAATIRNPTAAAEFRRIASDYSFWAFAHQSPNRPLQPVAAGRTAEIRVPTLIMTAEHDIPACREAADLLDETVPDSHKVVIAGTGHLMHLEKPEEFNRHLTSFLRRVAAKAPAR